MGYAPQTSQGMPQQIQGQSQPNVSMAQLQQAAQQYQQTQQQTQQENANDDSPYKSDATDGTQYSPFMQGSQMDNAQNIADTKDEDTQDQIDKENAKVQAQAQAKAALIPAQGQQDQQNQNLKAIHDLMLQQNQAALQQISVPSSSKEPSDQPKGTTEQPVPSMNSDITKTHGSDFAKAALFGLAGLLIGGPAGAAAGFGTGLLGSQGQRAHEENQQVKNIQAQQAQNIAGQNVANQTAQVPSQIDVNRAQAANAAANASSTNTATGQSKKVFPIALKRIIGNQSGPNYKSNGSPFVKPSSNKVPNLRTD